ncbi:MAG: hypothetical protein RJA57_28 [Bacteroidota bacterium]|jgi:hypothetical protein
MKKICLSVVGLVLTLFSAFAQAPKEGSAYKTRKLSLEEANLVSSYYRQDGDHAAVTGGLGTQQLTDISNTFDVKLVRRDAKDRKHTFDVEVGIDHYTSASSDKVDPFTLSSASYKDTRIYPSITWNRENEKKGNSVGAGLYLSSEFDYTSIGLGLNLSKKTRDRSGEFTGKAQVFLDRLKLILPIELRAGQPGGDDEDDYPSRSRNSFSTSLSYSQIVNQRLQLMWIADLVYQSGYLGLPFHRVYFTNNSVRAENLPGSRLKVPLGFRANYFMGDKVILRSFYRFYTDDWGITAHTLQLEPVFKLTPFFSLTPFYRYYRQTAADHFSEIRTHKITDRYYTSNFDLSGFTSHFYGAGFRITPPKGVFGIGRLNALELRYGHYDRSNGLTSDIISLHLKYK